MSTIQKQRNRRESEAFSANELKTRLRHGHIFTGQVRLAAFLGDPAAIQLFGNVEHTLSEEQSNWSWGLCSWGPVVQLKIAREIVLQLSLELSQLRQGLPVDELSQFELFCDALHDFSDVISQNQSPANQLIDALSASADLLWDELYLVQWRANDAGTQHDLLQLSLIIDTLKHCLATESWISTQTPASLANPTCIGPANDVVLGIHFLNCFWGEDRLVKIKSLMRKKLIPWLYDHPQPNLIFRPIRRLWRKANFQNAVAQLPNSLYRFTIHGWKVLRKGPNADVDNPHWPINSSHIMCHWELKTPDQLIDEIIDLEVRFELPESDQCPIKIELSYSEDCLFRIQVNLNPDLSQRVTTQHFKALLHTLAQSLPHAPVQCKGDSHQFGLKLATIANSAINLPTSELKSLASDLLFFHDHDTIQALVELGLVNEIHVFSYARTNYDDTAVSKLISAAPDDQPAPTIQFTLVDDTVIYGI